MKPKKLLGFFLLTFGMLIGLNGCMEKELSEIWDTLKDQNDRITKLEELATTLNNEVTNLQTLLGIKEKADYITGVTENEDGSQTITFHLSAPITIKNGKDGEVPVIGVEEDQDNGILYWTLDGKILLDYDKTKVPASIAPKIKISDDETWAISYDGGKNWTSTGVKATVGGESLFSKNPELSDGGKSYTFYLADGSTFKVPAYQEAHLVFSVRGTVWPTLSDTILLDETNPVLGYTIQQSDSPLTVIVEVMDNSSCEATATSTSGTAGEISFTGLGGNAVTLSVSLLQNGQQVVRYLLKVKSTDNLIIPVLPTINSVVATAGTDKISVTVNFPQDLLTALECHLYLDGVDKAPYTRELDETEISNGTSSFELGSELEAGTYSLQITPVNANGQGKTNTSSVVIEAAPVVDVPALPSSFSTSLSEKLASGVYHYEASYSGITMDIMKVDLSDPTVKIDLGTGKIPGELKTVKQHCEDNSYKGHRVVGAVNNDFFTQTSTANFGQINFSPCVKDGMFLSPSWGGYATLAFNGSNEPLIYNVWPDSDYKMYPYTFFSVGASTFMIQNHNVKSPDWTTHNSLLYNKFFDGDIPSHTGTLYVTIGLWGNPTINGKRVQACVMDKVWDTAPTTPTGNFIVAAFTNIDDWDAATKADAAFIVNPDVGSVYFTQRLHEADWKVPHEDIVTAWGGIPRIVTGGSVDNTSINGCSEPGPTDERPRTAIGYTSDKQYLWLVATEGESTTVLEEADIMVALGCSEAINCDGGGSTQMVTSKDGVNFTNVSKGNDGGSYRRVINAALIVSTAN